MARPYFTARHVPTLSALPAKLTRGRVYFIDDEGYMIVDFGDGPKVYGYRIGPAGRPGEPIPEMQSQIDSLTESMFGDMFNLLEFNAKRKADIKHGDKNREENFSALYEQISYLAEAVIELGMFMSVLDNNLKGTETALLKLITENQGTAEPIDSDIILTPEDQQNLLVDLIYGVSDSSDFGDTYSYGGYTWNVEKNEDGTFAFTLQD